jgi:serine/threonine protein kinase
MYHWRVLDGLAEAAGPFAEELADVERSVAYWHGSTGVRRRLEAIGRSSATVVIFLELFPHTLIDWLEQQVVGRDDKVSSAITMVERELRATVTFMNRSSLFHFDTHLENILTDGERLYLADFGLATSPRFELSAAEADFLATNASHDACHTVTRLVDWLVTKFTDVADWEARDEFIRRCAAGDDLLDHLPSAAAEVVARYAPIAVVINGFYRQLHLEDRTTPYPVAEVERACRTCTFVWEQPAR